MSNKVAKVMISVEYFGLILRAEFAKNPGYRIETNAPEDLKVVGFAPVEGEQFLRTIYAFVESESFAEVPEGNQPPLVDSFRYTLIRDE